MHTLQLPFETKQKLWREKMGKEHTNTHYKDFFFIFFLKMLKKNILGKTEWIHWTIKKIKSNTVSKLLKQFTFRMISSIFIQSSWYFFRQWASPLNWVSDKCFVFKCRKVDYFILSTTNWIRDRQERYTKPILGKSFHLFMLGEGLSSWWGGTGWLALI